MNEVTYSLAKYSSTVNSYADKIADALQAVAMVIILTFFLFDIMSWNKRLGQGGGSLTIQLFMEVAINYVIAFVLVLYSSEIFDLIVLFFNKAIGVVNSILPNKDLDMDVDVSGVSGWLWKQIVGLVGKLIEFIAKVSTNILIFMRFFQMYILKALAPLIIAFFMSEQTRHVAFNFFKHFSAYAFQGLLLVIIVKIYPAIIKDDYFRIAESGGFEGLMVAFASLAKGIVFIMALFGSQSLAKRLLSVS
ncbi:type IV secretion system protein [Streptococcus sp. zg-JUN1979]|uniref:type IV secretion system protein n=1 Tax=Streptococcus sp. zg-JUN1979 TaxID=3391450 RepID=UPI0039B0BB4E